MKKERESLFESEGWKAGTRLLSNISIGLAYFGLLFLVMNWEWWGEIMIISISNLFTVLFIQSFAEAKWNLPEHSQESWLGPIVRFVIRMAVGWILLSSLFFLMNVPGAKEVKQIAIGLSLCSVILSLVYSREPNPYWSSKESFIRYVLHPVLLSILVGIAGTLRDPYWLASLLAR